MKHTFMQKCFSIISSLSLLVQSMGGSALILIQPAMVSATTQQHTPVTFCHAKPADTAANGYDLITTDDDGLVHGHELHHSADIIPPYSYQNLEVVDTQMQCPGGYSPSSRTCPGRCYKDSKPLDSSKCVDMESVDVMGLVTVNSPGLNWDA